MLGVGLAFGSKPAVYLGSLKSKMKDLDLRMQLSGGTIT